MSFIERNFRNVIPQGIEACEAIHKTYELLDRVLIDGEDNVLLYKNLEIVRECESKMHEVCLSLVEMDERLANAELQVLYGPPPFFSEE